MDHARVTVAGVAADARTEMHCCFIDANSHRCGIRFETSRPQDFKNLFDARFVADRWKWIIALARRLRWVFTRPAVDLIELLSPIVVGFEVMIFQRPFGRGAVSMLVTFEIYFSQWEEGRPIAP